MELAEVLKYIRVNTDWLYTVIYQNKFFFIDYWSIVHFFSGFFLPVILSNLKFRNVYLKSFLILVLYEIIEISLIYLAFNIFKPETIKDQFTDIIIGLAGVYLIYLIKNFYLIKESKDLSNYLTAFISSFIISFIWVGFYKYKYNFESLNNVGLNLWAFGWWFTALLLVLLFYHKMNLKILNRIFTMLITYLAYLISLLIFEYTGYNLLGIREISKTSSHSLVFDLIHGTKVMHIFYLSAPLAVLLFHKLLLFGFHSYFKSQTIEVGEIEKNILSKVNLTES